MFHGSRSSLREGTLRLFPGETNSRPAAYWPLDAIDAIDDGKREPLIEIDAAFGEVAALLMLAAVVGFADILLRRPLIVSFIAVGLLAGQFLCPICLPSGAHPSDGVK